MDALLTPVSTTYLKPRKDAEPLLSEVKVRPLREVVESPKPASISTLDEALDILRKQPDYDSLISVLKHLLKDAQFQAPGPKSAAIVHQLVSEIAPNYWTLLCEGSKDEYQDEGFQSHDSALFVNCIQSVVGLNATLAHLKALVQENSLGTDAKRPDIVLHLQLFLNLLATILRGDDVMRTIWVASTKTLSTLAQKKVQSQALLSLVTGGRILSTAAQAVSNLGQAEVRDGAGWVAEGVQYVQWIASNIVSWVTLCSTDETELQFCADIFHRGISLGYFETFVKTIVNGMLLVKGADPKLFARVCLPQPQVAKKVLAFLLQYLSQKLNSLELSEPTANETVSAVAGIIHSIAEDSQGLRNQLVDWCTASSGAGLGDGIGIRRAVLAVLAKDQESIVTVFEKSLSQFGDQLYIKHAAILQQNVHTEILLLAAGYISRISRLKLVMTLRSGSYLSAISNRIAATQTRARFLGMVVGESMSSLTDQASQKLDFHMEEMDGEEAKWLKSLTSISDEIGSYESILNAHIPKPIAKRVFKPVVISKAKPKKRSEPEIKNSIPKPIIVEVDSSDEEEEDLVPYAKGSDPEDSDDDATLVQRNRPKAPVYVRDLILYLRDSENYDKQKLALQTAPVLIRRKANFGTEVSAHAEELAGLFVGWQDKFDLDEFDDLKLQGIIALIVSQPKTMAPWFSRTFFEGDYSLTQRVQVLVALGLSARELAGFETSEHKEASSFPSKRLPEKIEQLYLDEPKENQQPSSSNLKALPSTALDGISQSLTTSFLAPLAATAADATTGPDILKLETFTARYKSKSKVRPKVRAIPNTTAALLADYFFSPLTAHFQVALRSARPIVLNPSLLALYLQTLGILVHAAGPSTLSLPQLTSELWNLLLAVRAHVHDDIGALRGWLAALAALLEVNEGDMRRLCEGQGREVIETREWVGGVFHKIRGEDGGEENDVKMLAAGVLIRIGEAIEKYQALLMGDMIGFSQ